VEGRHSFTRRAPPCAQFGIPLASYTSLEISILHAVHLS
jgi:hypothetical protein